MGPGMRLERTAAPGVSGGPGKSRFWMVRMERAVGGEKSENVGAIRARGLSGNELLGGKHGPQL